MASIKEGRGGWGSNIWEWPGRTLGLLSLASRNGDGDAGEGRGPYTAGTEGEGGDA